MQILANPVILNRKAYLVMLTFSYHPIKYSFKIFCFILGSHKKVCMDLECMICFFPDATFSPIYYTVSIKMITGY